MGGSWDLCACSRKNIENDIRREKIKFFGKEVFSDERFTIKGLFYTSYRMAILDQNPRSRWTISHVKLHVEGNVFCICICIYFITVNRREYPVKDGVKEIKQWSI